MKDAIHWNAWIALVYRDESSCEKLWTVGIEIIMLLTAPISFSYHIVSEIGIQIYHALDSSHLLFT